MTTHDLLVSTNRATAGVIYERLGDALDRLAGTRIKTNVETGGEMSTKNFGIIDWYDYNRKGSGIAERLRYLEIKLSDWLFRAIKSAEVLPISRDYFRLRRPLDRRFYELARKHCGAKDKWRIGVEKLQKKCGSKQERKAFIRHMRETVEADHLPDYRVMIEGDHIVFTRRQLEEAQRFGAPLPCPAREEPAPAARIIISAEALDKVRELAPGWDKYALENMYRDFMTGKDTAKNEDARFLAWVPRFVKGRKP